MNKLDAVREKYPQYNGVSDEVLADALYKKYYSNIPREEYNKALSATIEPELTSEPIPTEPIPDPEDQSVLRSVADVPVSFGRGVVSGIKFISDSLGADNEFSQAAEGVEEYLASLMSAQSKQDSAEISRIMKDAEDKGVGSQVVAALKAFSVAPIDLVTNALGTAAPGIAAAVGTAVAGAPALATVGVLGAVGTTQGLGIVKSTIYEGTKQALLDAGASEDQAEARAQLAQEYGGKNLDLILGGGAFGGLASITGVDKTLAGPIAKKILGDSLIKAEAKKGLKQGYVSAILKEAGPEGLQAAQEKLSENISLQREGFDVPTFRGVAGATTLEGVVAGALATGVEFATPKEDTEVGTLDEESQRTQEKLADAEEKDARQPIEPDKQGVESGVSDSIEPSVDTTGDPAKAVEKSERGGMGAVDSNVGESTVTEGRVDASVELQTEIDKTKNLLNKQKTTLEEPSSPTTGVQRLAILKYNKERPTNEEITEVKNSLIEAIKTNESKLSNLEAQKKPKVKPDVAPILKPDLVNQEEKLTKEFDSIKPGKGRPKERAKSQPKERAKFQAISAFSFRDPRSSNSHFPSFFGLQETQNLFDKRRGYKVSPEEEKKIRDEEGGKPKGRGMTPSQIEEYIENLNALSYEKTKKQALFDGKVAKTRLEILKELKGATDNKLNPYNQIQAVIDVAIKRVFGDSPPKNISVIDTDFLNKAVSNLNKDKDSPLYKPGRDTVDIQRIEKAAELADLQEKIFEYVEQSATPKAKTEAKTEAKTKAKTGVEIKDATKDPKVIKKAKTVVENTENNKVLEDETFESLAEQGSQADGSEQTTPNNLNNINQKARPKWKQVINKYTPKALMGMADKARTKLFKIYTLRMLNDTNNLLGGSKMTQYLEALKISEANVAVRNSIIEEASKIMNDIQKFRKGKTNGRDNNNVLRDLGLVMNSATIRQEDPESLPEDDVLRKEYEKLPFDAKAIYKKLLKFYQIQTDGFVFDLVEKYQRVMVTDSYKRHLKIAEVLLQFGSKEQINKTYYDKENKETINYVDEYIKQEEEKLKQMEKERLQNLNELTPQGLKNVDLDIANQAKKVRSVKGKNSKRITPYFPLKRFGEYWFQVTDREIDDASGKRKTIEFYTFESEADRDAALEARAKELAETKSNLVINVKYNEKGELEGGDAGNRLLTAMRSFDVSSRIGDNVKDIIDSIVENRKEGYKKSGVGAAGIAEIDADKQKYAGVSLDKLKDELNDAVTQLTFMTLPENNIRKAFLTRRNVVGADVDVARVFSGQAISFAYQRARLRFTDDLFTKIDLAYVSAKSDKNVKRSALKIDLVRELDSRATHILGTSPTTTLDGISNGLTQFTFLWLLTAPASGLINIAGMAAIGMPYIAARFGYAKTNKVMLAYSSKYVSSKWFSSSKQSKDAQGNTVNTQYSTTAPTLEKKIDELDSDPKLKPVLKQAYKRFMHDNDVNASLTHDFTGAGRDQEIPGLARGFVGAYRTGVDFVSSFFHHTERFQREIMLMTAFELAYEKNIKENKPNIDPFEDAIQQAKDLTGMSIGDFTRAGKAPVLAQPFIKNIFQFKQYSMIQTYNMIRNAYVMTAFKEGDDPQLIIEKKEARSRIKGMLGITFLMAGAAGMPIYTFSMAALEAFSAAFDDEEDRIEDAEAYVHGLLIQLVGAKGAATLLRGLPGEVANIGVSERVSLDLANLWMRDSGFQLNYEDAYKATLINLLGPTVSIGANFARATNLYVNEYNPRAAFETAAPILASNISKAERYLQQKAAVSLTKGTTVQKDLDLVDVLYRSLGFSPENVLRKQKAGIRKKAGELRITTKKSRLLAALHLADLFNNEDDYNKVMKKIDEFNDKYPELYITQKTINDSLKRRDGNLEKRNLGDGVIITPKLRDRLDEEYPDFPD